MKWHVISMLWVIVMVVAVCALTTVYADGGVGVGVGTGTATGEVWEEDDHEVLIRSERGAGAGAKNRGKQPCRYVKGAWSECDPKTNMRSRTLTLKKGDQTSCEQTKTIQKKCKKGSAKKSCRYEKGTWSECNPQGEMTRNDKLKANSDASCDQTRQMTKKCKAKGTKPTKGGRRNRQ